jgi:hypothetical protein
MTTIWKFQLDLFDEQQIILPVGAKILTAQINQGSICLWAEVEAYAKKENRSIFIVGTGHPLPNCVTKYIATVQADNFVWHIYE